MIQLRYFSAFLLSSLTFSLLYFGFISLPTVEKKLKPAPSKVIKVALIAPVKKVVKPMVKATPMALPVPIVPPVLVKKPKKIIKKKIVKKKVIKKIKPKKIVKKKVIKKKPKKVIKKKVVKKKVIKKVKPKKRIIKQPVETYVPIAPPIERYVPPVASPVYVAPKPALKPVIKPTIVPQPRVNNSHHKKAFLRNVRSKIIANKKYPKIAKRRHIEGSVKVRFDITKHGHVRNIR